MDPLLIFFHRQYLQQILISNIRYPPSKLLVMTYIQDQLSRYFFSDNQTYPLPPVEYQRKVLKKIIAEIEIELSKEEYGHDDDEHALSDELMSCMGHLSSLPQLSEFESAQIARTLSYYVPGDRDSSFRDRPILIRESPNLLAAGSNVGLRTWEACLHLAYYLCTEQNLAARHPDHKAICGANIIELGAGTGLLSLLCAQKLGAKHVVATDGLIHVVDGIKANVQLNSADYNSQESKNLPQASVLDWTDPSNLDEVLQYKGTMPTYDYILGADITYHPELFAPLAHVLKLLRTKFSLAKILIGATVRNENTLHQFYETCTNQYGLAVETVQAKDWKCPAFKDQTGLFHEQAFPIVIMDIK